MKPLVVYLARAVEGIDSLRGFAESYVRHPAGCLHDLLVLFKGFIDDAAERERWEAALEGIPCATMEVPDHGFDLGSYRLAALAHPGTTLFLVNSHSAFRVDGWLDLVLRHADDRTLVGATGSWESLASPPRSETPEGVGARLHRRLRGLRHWLNVAPFPNPHLRSNALLIPSGLLPVLLPQKRIATKLQAMLCESGRNGISSRARRLGLTLRVAGADGSAHAWQDWPKSRTFRSGNQEALIVEDNRTRQYARADPRERARLAFMAWGVQS